MRKAAIGSVVLVPQVRDVDQRRQQLVFDFRHAIGPRNSLEGLLVEEIAELTLEIVEYRLVKNRYLKARRYDGVKAALAPVIGPLQASEVATQWLSQNTEDVAPQVGTTDVALDPDDVAACAMVVNLETVERLERLMAAAEARRALVFQQLERLRAGPLTHVVSATKDIEARACDDSEHRPR